LEIAINKTVRYAPLERGRQVVDDENLDDALDFLTRCETKCHGANRAEQAVPSDRQPEQFRVVPPAARACAAVRIDEHERFDVADNRLHRQASSVNVRRQPSTDRQAISAGLLLRDALLLEPAGLPALEIINKSRPHDP
jgi:hypothetical protein